MTNKKVVPIILVANALLAGCTTSAFFSRNGDVSDKSGKTKDQMVSMHLLYGSASDDEKRKAVETGLVKKGVPKTVLNSCRPTTPRAHALPALAIPFVIATAQSIFNYAMEVRDKERAAAKERAVRQYGAKVTTEKLFLLDGDCIVLLRTSESKTAAVFVYRVKQFSAIKLDDNDTNRERAMALTPVFVQIRLAAAETLTTSETAGSVNISTAIAISAVQRNPKISRDEVIPVTISTFDYGDLEIGKKYCAEDLPGKDKVCGNMITTALLGPIFTPIFDAPTIGAVSVSVTEHGALANFTGPSDADKAARAAFRSALGTSIKTIFENN